MKKSKQVQSSAKAGAPDLVDLLKRRAEIKLDIDDMSAEDLRIEIRRLELTLALVNANHAARMAAVDKFLPAK